MSQFTAWPRARYPRHASVLPDQRGVSLVTARALAWAAQLAYETDTPDKLAHILADWEWDLISTFAGGSPGLPSFSTAHGYVARVGTMRVVAFSGTDPMRIGDWILDLMAHRTHDGVHAGFDAGIDAVWDAMRSALGANGPVFLTGHSLGGALATIAAFRLLRHSHTMAPRLFGVSTYGMPRVGDTAFASAMRAVGLGPLVLRLVYGNDIVPRLPPPDEPFGYRHVGQVMMCRRGRRFAQSDQQPDTEETTAVGDGMLARVVAALRPPQVVEPVPVFPGAPAAAAVVDRLPATIRDHMPDRYLHALGLL